MEPSDKVILDIFAKYAPLLQRLIEGEVDVTVTSLEKWLAYSPSGKDHLNIIVGEDLPYESVSAQCMREGRLVIKRMEGTLFGQGYVGKAVPVRNNRGEVIGSIGYLKIIDTKEEFETMIIGRNRKMKEAYHHAVKAAGVDSNVLILGETGTGKDLIAQIIHAKSSRKDHPLVVVNCAAIPESLFESELFGYERGAFTGAMGTGKKGFFELAGRGTIYLDEIGDLGLSLQSKLLRVLQTKKIMRVGGQREIETSVRVIASTNKNLEQMVLKNYFRSDLYFRLSELTIIMPPVRERKEDLPLLIDRILERTVKELGKEVRTIAPTAYKMLLEYDYPGNVRELENILQKGIVMTESDTVREEDLVHAFRNTNAHPSKEPKVITGQRRPALSSLKNMERQMLLETLRILPTKKDAARVLGISRDTLYRKMKRFGLGERSLKN